jgi:hypothetical protein
LLTPDELNQAGEITDADVEQARQWWYYQPSVKARFKRILDARRRARDGAPATR